MERAARCAAWVWKPAGEPADTAKGSSFWRWVVGKVVLRLAVLAAFIGLAHFASVRKVTMSFAAHARAVEQASPARAVGVFLVGAVAFNAISPTGYLPTLLAGFVFDRWWLAWAVAYTQVNLAAALNLLLVRGPCHDAIKPVVECMAAADRRMTGGATGQGAFSWLDDELRRASSASASAVGWRRAVGAGRVVALVRLPYLWGGLFNYIFSLSSVRARPYFIGNALGFLPGALLFSRLGHSASGLLVLLVSGTASGAELGLAGAEFCLLVGAVAALGWHFRRAWKLEAAADIARKEVGGRYMEGVSLLNPAEVSSPLLIQDEYFELAWQLEEEEEEEEPLQTAGHAAGHSAGHTTQQSAGSGTARPSDCNSAAVVASG